MISKKEFKEKLAALIGTRLLKVGAGGSAGSIFSLEFYDRKQLQETSESPATSANLYIMIKCAWRLDDIISVKPITSWNEDSDFNGVMTVKLKSLVNDVVSRVELSDFMDLEIYFESGKRLFVFCDITPYVVGEDNWFIGTSDGYYSVNTALNCVFEKKE